MSIDPLTPRITKSTAILNITARFPTTAALLKRFKIANGMAALWDGERDGIREAVKVTEAGTYDDVILTWTATAAVGYPNAEGKHQIENTLQTTIPCGELEAGNKVAVLHISHTSPAEFLDQILSLVHNSKDDALEYLSNRWVGSGNVIDNEALYRKDPGSKSDIVIIPKQEA